MWYEPEPIPKVWDLGVYPYLRRENRPLTEAEFKLFSSDSHQCPDKCTLEDRWGLDDNGKDIRRFAICWSRFVMTTSGEWEYEPMPSSRDDDFLKRARFPTYEAALQTYRDHCQRIINGEKFELVVR